MTNEMHQVLVLRDGNGRYFRLPMAELERFRVSADEAVELAEQFEGDTRGFFTLIELIERNPGYTSPDPGSTAILIGLLLPAVQKVR